MYATSITNTSSIITSYTQQNAGSVTNKLSVAEQFNLIRKELRARPDKFIEYAKNEKLDLTIRDQNQNTILHIAVEEVARFQAIEGNRLKKEQLLDFLIKNGVDIDAVNEYAETALVTAIRYNQPWIDPLLSYNASVDQKNINNETPIHIALAAHDEFTALSKNLVAKSAEYRVIDSKDANHRTTLHNACHNGNIASVRLLLKYNANIDIKDNKGNTPLHHANFCKNKQQSIAIIEMLLEKGANRNATNNNGLKIIVPLK